jgi:hypothetical protein
MQSAPEIAHLIASYLTSNPLTDIVEAVEELDLSNGVLEDGTIREEVLSQVGQCAVCLNWKSETETYGEGHVVCEACMETIT